MRRVLGVSVACGVLVVGAAMPAGAANLSSDAVATAYTIMMSKAEAKQLGVKAPTMGAFAVTQSDKGTPDAPWLCDLSGSAEVEGRGARSLVSQEYLSLAGTSVGSVSQEVHLFGSVKQAKGAYRDIVAKIAQCEGPQQPDPDPDTEDPGGFSTQLTNGSKKAADGDGYLWVRSQTTSGNVDGFVSHEYTTVRQMGRFLQIIEVESEGTGAPDLTAKQIATADRLTDALGDRWRAAFS